MPLLPCLPNLVPFSAASPSGNNYSGKAPKVGSGSNRHSSDSTTSSCPLTNKVRLGGGYARGGRAWQLSCLVLALTAHQPTKQYLILLKSSLLPSPRLCPSRLVLATNFESTFSVYELDGELKIPDVTGQGQFVSCQSLLSDHRNLPNTPNDFNTDSASNALTLYIGSLRNPVTMLSL